MQHLRPAAQVLHQDGALLNWPMHGVPVIRVTGKAPGTHDQINPARQAKTDLHTKLVGVAALALANALHLWRVPAAGLRL